MKKDITVFTPEFENNLLEINEEKLPQIIKKQ